MKNQLMIACLVLLLSCASCARTASRKSEVTTPATNAASNTQAVKVSQPVRLSAEEMDAAEPAVVAASDGSVYVAWVEHRTGRQADVWLAHLDGEAKPLGTPTRINPEAGQASAWHGDPPTLGIARDGTVFVGWTARAAAQGQNTVLYLSASRDGGKTFGAPVKVNDDRKPAVHGMHSLGIAPDGRIHMAWLDERNVKPPPTSPSSSGHKHKESNREVFFASSSDGGRSFSPNRRIATDVCPCCKTSLAAGADNRVYVSWRQVLPGEFRHIAVTSSADGGESFSEPVIVSDDRWMIAGCPVSGAALAVGTDGALRVLWYTAGDAGPTGLYWSESRDGGKTFVPRRHFAESGGRGTPVLMHGRDDILLAVWEGGGVEAQPMTGRLSDQGQSGKTAPLAGAGELPAAASGANQVFVAYVSKHDHGRSIWLVRERISAAS